MMKYVVASLTLTCLVALATGATSAPGKKVSGPPSSPAKHRTQPPPLPPAVEAELMGIPPEKARAYRRGDLRSLALSLPRSLSPREGFVTVRQVPGRLRYRKGYLAGIPVHVIEANLQHPEVRVAAMVARGGIGQSEAFGSMLARARPNAAITGTFFGLRNRLPTGDIVVDGRNLYRGFIGTALAITDGNVVSFISTDYGEEPSWHLFDTVLRTGPRLIDAGQLVVAPQEEGFVSLDRHSARTRTAVGITTRSRLLLVAVKQPVSLYRLGLLMRALGAYHAAALDGGTSTALAFGGHVVAAPGRAMTNLHLIYASRDRYERARPHLVPPLHRAAIRPSE